MIKHIVMFRFMENAEGKTKAENVLTAKSMLEKLNGVVPSLKSSEIHLDVGSKSTNYDLVLISEFDDEDGLEQYIVHPAHKAVGEFMKKVRLDRACVDYTF